MQTKYRVVEINNDGKISTRTEVGPEDWASDLIALRLIVAHNIYHLSFCELVELVNTQGCAFGYQRAFCDENCTIVVTELR